MRKLKILSAVTALAASAFAWNDGDLIADFTFDDDANMLSRVNTGMNPAAPVLVGNPVITNDVYRKYVNDNGTRRLNTGSLFIGKSDNFVVDLTGFGLDESVTSLTVEFYYKAGAHNSQNYEMMMRMGTAATLSAPAVPGFKQAGEFYIQRANSDTKISAVCDSLDSGSPANRKYVGATYTSSSKLFNQSKWHYCRVVVTSDTVNNSFTAKVYSDYNAASTNKTFNGSVWSGETPGSGRSFYLSLGSAISGKVMDLTIDEFKIYCGEHGATTPTESVWDEQEVIADFTFDDNANMLSRVNTGCNPAAPVLVGNPVITNDVYRKYVYENGALRENTGSLFVGKADNLVIDMTDFLIDEAVTNVMVEFFYKGENPTLSSEMLLRLGIGGELSSAAVPTFLSAGQLYVQRGSDDWRLHAVADSLDSTVNSAPTRKYVNPQAYDGSKRLFNNGWHHCMVMLYGVGSKFRGSINSDYANAVTSDSASSVWSGKTTLAGQRYYLSLGSATSGDRQMDVFIDELKIYKGTASSVLRFTHQVSEAEVTAPVDTLVYMPLDNYFSSEAHKDWPITLRSGGRHFDTDVMRGPDNTMWTRDRTAQINSACNTHSIADSSVHFYLPYWGLKSPYLKSATFEAIVKGIPETINSWASNSWKSPLGISSGKEPMKYLIQITGEPRRYYFRLDCTTLKDGGTPTANDRESMDCYVPVGTGNPLDGKWHHLAVTIEETESGQQTFRFYCDYQLVATKSPTNYVWDGFAVDDDAEYLRLDKGIKLDEFRISRGALDPSKFMCPARLGMLILFR